MLLLSQSHRNVLPGRSERSPIAMSTAIDKQSTLPSSCIALKDARNPLTATGSTSILTQVARDERPSFPEETEERDYL